MVAKGYIYIIKNNINNKVYIGQTINKLNRRLKQHFSAARCGSNTYFAQAIRKIGEENFYIEPLEEVEIEFLDEQEIYWISKYNSYENGYNSTRGGQLYHQIIDTELLKQIELKWNQGLNQRQIASELNIPIDKVNHYISHCKNISSEEKRQRGNQSLYKIKNEDLLLLWELGYGVTQITEQFGGNHSTNRQRLKELGITEEELTHRGKKNMSNAARKNQKKRRHGAYQYDLKGNFIQHYEYIKNAAEKYNIDSSTISHCCKGDILTAAGYIWLYEKDENLIKERVNRIVLPKASVFQYSLDGNFIAEYESFGKAAKAVGAKSPSRIYEVCDKTNRSAKGYKWYSHKL